MPAPSVSSAAVRAMNTYFPEWTANNPTANGSVDASRIFNARESTLCEDDSIFILSANWILRPEGLREFYAELAKYSVKPEITYDPFLGAFNVRCAKDRIAEFLTAAHEILNAIVAPEVDKVSMEFGEFEGEGSTKIRHINEWRASRLDEEELEAYEPFTYPEDIAKLGFKATWRIPQDFQDLDLTIQTLFGLYDPVAELEAATGSMVRRGIDGQSLYIGGKSKENIDLVQRKLGVLLKHYRLSSQLPNNDTHALYVEGVPNCLAEIRYLAQVNRRLLTTIVLDPAKFPLDPKKSYYGKLFEKASFIRMLPFDRAKNAYKPLLEVYTTPAVSEKDISKPFGAFTGYVCKAKQRDFGDEAIHTIGNTASLETDKLPLVNPQAAPNVLSWQRDIAQSGILLNSGPISNAEAVSMDKLAREPALTRSSDSSTHIISPPRWIQQREPRATGSTVVSSIPTTDASSQRESAGLPHLKGLRNESGSSLSGRANAVSDATTSTVTNPAVRLKRVADLKNSMDMLKITNGPSENKTDTMAAPQVFDRERQTSDFRETMKQRAGRVAASNRRKIPQSSTGNNNGQPEDTAYSTMRPNPDVVMMEKITNRLVQILEPLRLFRGAVSLKAEIGRFVFTKINFEHITVPGQTTRTKSKTLAALEEYLDQRHTSSKDLLFSSTVSTKGGDADYIASLTGPGNTSTKIWRPRTRRIYYDFNCMTVAPSGTRSHFTLSVDGENFSYEVRRSKGEGGKIFVHCMRRVFDVQLRVEAKQDLEENCGPFAQELVESLEVRPQKIGAPHLAFTNHLDWAAIFKTVRIRRVASYSHRDNNCILEISQLQDMNFRVTGQQDKFVQYDAIPSTAVPKEGMFPLWYEACLQSSKINDAFDENRQLGFADEASWSAEKFRTENLFRELVNSATYLTKRMDGVGYWVDNNQGAKAYGKPPANEAEALQQANRGKGLEYHYW